MNDLEEMFVTLVLALMAFFILLRLVQFMLWVSEKFKQLSAK